MLELRMYLCYYFQGDYFYKKYNVKSNNRYIVYTKDLKVEDGIIYLPVYMAGLI